MLIASHMLVAGYVGERIGDPVLAFFVGIIIHFLLDLVPHYDTTDDGKFTFRQISLLVIDGIIGLVIVYQVLLGNNFNASYIAGAIGGLVPDILDNSPFWKKAFRRTIFGKKLHLLHKLVHGKQPIIYLGLSIQIIIIIVFAALAFKGM